MNGQQRRRGVLRCAPVRVGECLHQFLPPIRFDDRFPPARDQPARFVAVEVGTQPGNRRINHNLTNPWRFRVLGPEALAALKDAAGPEAAAKLERAPTLIAASVVRSDDDPVTDEEDFAAAAAATFIVLLGAHARGLGGYWRTPAVLRTPEGRAALRIPAEERMLGLLHLGRAKGPDKLAPERAPVDEIRSYLP